MSPKERTEWHARDREEWRARWDAKQRAAAPSRYYGDGGTIHSSGQLDVEVGPDGKVAAVWFRCQMLPFKEHRVSAERAHEMSRASDHVSLTGVEVLDPPEVRASRKPPPSLPVPVRQSLGERLVDAILGR